MTWGISMNWSAEFEYQWQLFLTGLKNSNQGFYVLEYDQPLVRDALLKRLYADFSSRGWTILPEQFFVSSHSLAQEIGRALEGKSAKAVIVHLTSDTLETRGIQMLNMARESLYSLPVNIIFLAHSAAYRRLLVEARDLVSWIKVPYRFTTQSEAPAVVSMPVSRSGLSGDLLQRLSDTLLRCGPFYSARELNAVFTDRRLYPWRYKVPDAHDPKSRVQALIAYLHDQATVDGDNALALFVQVLRDQTDVNDACYRELDRLAIALSGGSATSSMPSIEITPPPPTDPYTPYEIAMRTLLARLGKDHPRYNEALIYQQRLDENLKGTRLYGDTETRRAERAEILARLSSLAMATLNVPFTELGGTATTINTGGGAYAGGDVTTEGDFVGRDKITIIGNGNVIGDFNQVTVNKPATPAQPQVMPDRVRLLNLLTHHFSLDELNTLCFAVGVNFDELSGAGLTGKARELIAYCERHTCMPKLIAAGKTLRPELDWS